MSFNPSTLTREAGTSNPTGRPGRRRPSTSHVLIGIAVVLAFGFNYLALQNRDATVQVAIASAPLVEGTALSASDVEMVELAADFKGLGGLVLAADLSDKEGWIVGRSIAAGDLIDKGSLVEPGSFQGLRVMSIPIGAEHAAGATVGIGDRVDVISVSDGEAIWVATGLEVVGTADRDQGALSGVGTYFIVVAVGSDQALALAAAIDEGSLEVVRSTGADPIGEGS